MYFDYTNPLYRLYLKVRAINQMLDNREACFYCGDIATEEDHVIPHSFLHGLGAARTGYGTDTLPACRECNGMLGSLVFDTLEERLDELAFKTKTKYKQALSKPDWAERELNELTGNLRGQIRAQGLKKLWVEAKLDNLTRFSSETPAVAIYPPLPRRTQNETPKAPESKETGKDGHSGE